MDKKIIVINNPAAKEGGVLSILREFLDKISSLKCNRKFYVIVSVKELKKYETENLKIKVISKQNFKKRILWDNFLLKRFLNINKIKPDIFISLQNTGVNLSKKIPQIIYYQQPLTLSKLNWSIIKKEERLYWMYKKIYPLFIKQYLKRVKKVIVQTEWVKNKFSEIFKYDKKNIILLKPKIKKIDTNDVKNISKDRIRIFYPATPYIYKNHKIIIEALGKIKEESSKKLIDVECIFTYFRGENLELDKLVRKYKLENTIKEIGKISYAEVLEYYKNSDLLVFPSYLETYGLPLIEAQEFALDILASDLEYSREVIGKYEQCTFIEYNSIESWKKRLEKIIEERKNDFYNNRNF